MLPNSTLKRSAAEALAYVQAQPGVREAEVFMASNGGLFARLNYTSRIPSNGVEEPKSLESYGVGIRVAFETPEGVRLGFGSEPSDISLEGVGRALEKARRSAVRDPDFVSLPHPTGEKRTLARYHDPQLLRIKDGDLVGTGWLALEGALSAFASSEELLALAGSPESVAALGLIAGGDVTVLQESVAVASTHFPRVQSDVSTIIMAFLTAMVEERNAKGTGWWVGTRLADFSSSAGREAARRALESMDGARVKDGEYRVVMGPQAVSDLMNHVIRPSFQLDTFYSGASAFQGKLTGQVASPELHIYDHGAAPGLAGSKGMTCEGLPTGRTDIVREGLLVGLLSNYYRSQQILRDPRGKEKLGVDPREHQEALTPRNGFRFAPGGGRSFDAPPGIFGTNIVIEGSEPCGREELLKRVGNGLYIGRIWYTYPINGLAAGDFTCTVVGDSFLIRDGRLDRPLKPNTVRINDNIHNLLQNVVGVGKDVRGTIVWAADQIIYTPEIAFARVQVKEISEYMEHVYAAR